MSINYDEIIELANRRKNALQHTAQCLARVDEIEEHLAYAARYAKDLGDALAALDREAKGLIGADDAHLAERWCRQVAALWDDRNVKAYSGHQKTLLQAARDLAERVK